MQRGAGGAIKRTEKVKENAYTEGGGGRQIIEEEEKERRGYRGGRGRKEVLEEMSGILIGVQVYLQEPIQPQTHTDTLIKYHLTICDCVRAGREINPRAQF